MQNNPGPIQHTVKREQHPDGVSTWGRAGCSRGLDFSFFTGLSFTALVSAVLFFTGTSVWGHKWRKEGLNELKLTSGDYGTLRKTECRGFNTNV